MNFDIKHDLLNPLKWPRSCFESSHAGIVLQAVDLVTVLKTTQAGNTELDVQLRYMFNHFSRLLPWLPDQLNRGSMYTRNFGDLRDLLAMVPDTAVLDLQRDEIRDGRSHWRVRLHDLGLDIRGLLRERSDVFGAGYSPNLALACLLLVACIVGVIEDTLFSQEAKTARRRVHFKQLDSHLPPFQWCID